MIQILLTIRLAGIVYCMNLMYAMRMVTKVNVYISKIRPAHMLCDAAVSKKCSLFGYEHYFCMHDIEYQEPSFVSIAQLTKDTHEFDSIAYDPVWASLGKQKGASVSTQAFDAHGTAHTASSVAVYSTAHEQGSTPDLSSVASSTTDHAVYNLPPLELFHAKKSPFGFWQQDKEAEAQRAQILENKLARFGIVGKVVSIKYGPVITLFEYQPDVDAKISKILALEDDLALALQANSIRIIAPIPGKNVVGFEIARHSAQRVDLADLFHQRSWLDHSRALPVVLGVDVVGEPVIVDMARMPHLLVAGATGAGKSVALNVMLMSLLVKKTPQDLQLILIDPKQLEFSPYYDIPHLLFPIITHVSDAHAVLEWLVGVMQERYSAMASVGVRSMADYNRVAQEQDFESLSYIVVVIDELADLMLLVGREVEHLIARLVQMARAAGIHMVVATQRPSVDVLTGTIKANFSCRLACRVASKIDSRTIIDTIGAEKLLGKGDMLYLDSSGSLRRVHGAYVSDKEVETVTAFIRSQAKAHYHEIPSLEAGGTVGALDDADMKLLNEITAYLQTIDEISISSLQRAFKIGYNRSARIIEFLEKEGRLLCVPGSKMRKVIK